MKDLVFKKGGGNEDYVPYLAEAKNTVSSIAQAMEVARKKKEDKLNKLATSLGVKMPPIINKQQTMSLCRFFLINEIEHEVARWRSKKYLVNSAEYFIRFALKSDLFRVANKVEVIKKSAQLVLFGDQAIIPRELSRQNKILIDRLNEICKIEKERKAISFFRAVTLMKEQATCSLFNVLEKPRKGEKVFIDFSSGKQNSYMLCEIIEKGGKFQLIIEDVICNEGIVEEKYRSMKKARRFLSLAFMRARKITTFIKDKKIFDDTRIFLRDVLRGLEYERIDASREASINRKKLENLEKLKVS